LEGVIARRPRGAQVVLAAAVQRQIRDFASDNRYLDSSPEEIIVTGSRISVASMPRIALWSPSDRMELPTRFVDRWATFGDATDELIEALENAGYDRHGLFAVDGGGIALITGLERTHADGTPLPPRQRWTAAEDSEVTSISDFIARLFLGESGNYRMIAFVITPQLPPIAAGSVLTAETSKVLYMSGETTLPRVLASKLIEDSRCFVLIYEYERRPGEMAQHIPGADTALFHPTAGGILESLEALR